jgi:hypothetical protein
MVDYLTEEKLGIILRTHFAEVVSQQKVAKYRPQFL